MRRRGWNGGRTFAAVLLGLGCLLLAGTSPGHGAPDPSSVPVLHDGDVAESVLAGPLAQWTGRIEVPEDAVALGLVLAGDRDVDLHLRRGRPPEGDLLATADVSSVDRGVSTYEIVSLTVDSTPRLEPGTWFVTVVASASSAGCTRFRMIVFLDRRDSVQTLLPGRAVGLQVPPGGGSAALRTCLPCGARGAVLRLDAVTPTDLAGVNYVLEAPGGSERRGRAVEEIFLPCGDIPSGVWAMVLTGSPDAETPVVVTVSAQWSLKGGLTLPRPPAPLLQPGVARAFSLGGPCGFDVQRFVIQVPPQTGGLVIEAADANGLDVDLLVRRGCPPGESETEADWMATSTGPAERLVIAGRQPLTEGTYHALVLLHDNQSPTEVTVRYEPLAAPGENDERTWGTVTPSVLVPDEWTRGVVRVSETAVRWHAIDLPAGTSSFHVQILDASAALDLLVIRAADGSVATRSFSPLVDEYLEAEFPAPLTEDRRLYVGVLNRDAWHIPAVTYRVSVGLGRRPVLPEDFEWPPRLRLKGRGLVERMAAATVELTIADSSGGSGACVTPGGLVLSCRHCLAPSPAAEIQREGIVVSFPRSLDGPPVQTFLARVVAEHPAGDLVLLEPATDVFGRPLSPDPQFPWIALGDSTALHLGDTLWVAGYPETGSDVGRTPVVITRGILAGLESRAGRPVWIKTDAWIAPGHSGGPVMNGAGRLVGVSAATLGTTESLGLATPTSILPREWLTRIRKAVR